MIYLIRSIFKSSYLGVEDSAHENIVEEYCLSFSMVCQHRSPMTKFMNKVTRTQRARSVAMVLLDCNLPLHPQITPIR